MVMTGKEDEIDEVYSPFLSQYRLKSFQRIEIAMTDAEIRRQSRALCDLVL